MPKYLIALLFIVCGACRRNANTVSNNTGKTDTNFFAWYADAAKAVLKGDSTLPEKIVAFAETQLGVSYKYCSMTPDGGFDCSGFVNYVFNHFEIKVPRSSVEFTNIGEEIPLSHARPCDIILFTGTNPNKRAVGHLGIIITNYNGSISFIQSTSGSAYGVVISPLNKSYMLRFVKVIRIVE